MKVHHEPWKKIAFWPAAGFVDRQLSYPHLSFELKRAEISEGRVPADRIVEPLDVVEDIGSRGVAGARPSAAGTARSHIGCLDLNDAAERRAFRAARSPSRAHP